MIRGIPNKFVSYELPEIEKPTVWEYGVHRHQAHKRGLHFDLRLGDPRTKRAHSWAMPPTLPAPGKVAYAIQQPTHTMEYMDFEGKLGTGYGAGLVDLHDRDKIEVVRSKPGHIVFNVYKSTGPQEFVLHRLEKKVWRLINRTPTQESLKVPTGKPDYKDLHPERLPLHDDKYVMSAKIDDAHNLFLFPAAGEPVRVVSYRVPKRTPGGVIEHTHKVPGLLDARVPSDLGGTAIRGGLYAVNPRTGKAVESHILGGILNSDVWKSRKKQEEHGSLVPVIYDVERYRGRDVSGAPYSEKLKILKKVVQSFPSTFRLPTMAFTQSEKQRLLKQIEEGTHPHTNEGVVLWNLHASEKPIKSKFREEHDVYVRGFFPPEAGSKYQDNAIGGFTFSHAPGGPVVGRVGTGLSDAQRRDMFKSPKKYLGLVAKVKAQSKYKATGALRAPAFTEFHLDKNPQDRLDAVL